MWQPPSCFGSLLEVDDCSAQAHLMRQSMRFGTLCLLAPSTRLPVCHDAWRCFQCILHRTAVNATQHCSGDLSDHMAASRLEVSMIAAGQRTCYSIRVERCVFRGYQSNLASTWGGFHLRREPTTRSNQYV
jgi:hypothetical protein